MFLAPSVPTITTAPNTTPTMPNTTDRVNDKLSVSMDAGKSLCAFHEIPFSFLSIQLILSIFI